jgi:hypothetical protein
MGGNGLVPYGTPRPPHEGPPDVVDMIQASRRGGGCHPAGDGAAAVVAGPAILAPLEKPEEIPAPKAGKGAPATEKPGRPE